MYDIAIIGSGPAGATLARLLNTQFKIIVIDKKSIDSSRDTKKPCGGLLAADAQKALSKYNLTLPKRILVDPQIFSVKTIDLKQNLLRYYQRFYINLDRDEFDKWLISLIPKSVEFVGGAICNNVQKSENEYVVTYVKDGVENSIISRYVIGADGSDSVLSKNLFPRKKIRRYFSIQQWFPEQNASPFYSCIFDREITDSYCWSVSKDGFFILGGAFPLKGSKEKFELLKTKLKTYGFKFDNPIKTEACFVSRPQKMRDFCLGKNGAFLVGEAAGLISPSSLEGISYALNSAYILSDVLNSRCKNPNRKYRLKTFPIRMKLLFKTFKIPFMYWPFVRKFVMKSGLNSIRILNENTENTDKEKTDE